LQPSLTLGLPSYGTYLGGDWARLTGLAAQAEQAGFDRVSLSEHLVMGPATDSYPYGTFPGGPEGPWLEPLTVLAAIGAVTSALRLGTSVLLAPLRPPALLAKTAATLDVLTGGRLDLGVGTGWQAKEYEAVGLAYADRGRLYTDALAACTALWRPGPVSFRSGSLSFDDVYCSPLPVQEGGVPLWISGKLTERNLDRIVRFGRGWIPAPTAGFRDVREGVPRLRAALRAAGRDPASVQVRVSPRPVRDEAGQLDLAASAARIPGLVEIGGTDIFLQLEAWCPDARDAAGFLAELAGNVRAVLM